MLNSLSVQDSQRVAESLVEELMDSINSLDPSAISEVLRDGLQEDYVQDLVAALLGVDTSELPDWVDGVLQEPDADEGF